MFIIEHFGWFATNMINHTKILSLAIMLLLIESNDNIWLFKFFNLLCVYIQILCGFAITEALFIVT